MKGEGRNGRLKLLVLSHWGTDLKGLREEENRMKRSSPSVVKVT